VQISEEQEEFNDTSSITAKIRSLDQLS